MATIMVTFHDFQFPKTEHFIDKVTVIFDNLTFYGQLDEKLFFMGLKRIPAITIINAVTFEIDRTKLNDILQRINLEGLLTRYAKNQKRVEKFMKNL